MCWGGGGAQEVERSSSAVREGCNAETCQKRAPGPPFGMWPVCLPRKYRAVEREEKGKREQTHVRPHHGGEAADKERSCWSKRKPEVEKREDGGRCL